MFLFPYTVPASCATLWYVFPLTCCSLPVLSLIALCVFCSLPAVGTQAECSHHRRTKWGSWKRGRRTGRKAGLISICQECTSTDQNLSYWFVASESGKRSIEMRGILHLALCLKPSGIVPFLFRIFEKKKDKPWGNLKIYDITSLKNFAAKNSFVLLWQEIGKKPPCCSCWTF